MFQEGNYDIQEFSLPPNGMNQFISPDVLPPNFCYFLENIIPSPLGVGQVRYGTSLVDTLVDPDVQDPNLDIIRSFPFILNTVNETIKQSILYVGYFDRDLSASNFTYIDASNFTFDSDTTSPYKKDIKIKVVYNFNGTTYNLYSEIENVSVEDDTVSITLSNNLLPGTEDELTITQVWCQFGSIYSYDYNTKILNNLIRGLSIACVPRCTYFQQIMMICNGVDNVMTWDGTILEDLFEFILEIGAINFVRDSDLQFSFTRSDTFDIQKYSEGGSIELSVNGEITPLTINTIFILGDLVTIGTGEELPAFAGADRVVLFYRDIPPQFSYMYATKDRIWALGPGAVGLEYRETNEQLRVYYSYRPNPTSGYGFFNENTKTVPSINMSDKHDIQDNFEAICQVNGLLAFMGRKKTQVWAGYTPGQNGDFSWQMNLPVGIFHGDLLLEIANDVYFVSQSSIQSFSTLNVAKQFSANSENAIDNIVKSFNSQATTSNALYRKCVSFKYNEGAIAGFKISNNKIIASLFTVRLYSWFYLSGDFRLANCFMDLDKQFYIFIGNKIFKYADGNDGEQKIYGDQDGESLIPIVWTPGLNKFKGKRGYANKRYELALNYSSSFILNNKNTISISISGDIPRSFYLNNVCSFQYRGDLIDEEPLGLANSRPVDPGLRLDSEYEIVNKRLKFASSSFWISITGYVMNGPLTFRRIRLFGIGERNG